MLNKHILLRYQVASSQFTVYSLNARTSDGETDKEPVITYIRIEYEPEFRKCKTEDKLRQPKIRSSLIFGLHYIKYIE